ncbi:flagellin [Sporosarcina koreensis]|uniref:flagellin n=1 Tax=Sporosarcina koreensis TaxID=334735 RepID=UPI003CC7C49C
MMMKPVGSAGLSTLPLRSARPLPKVEGEDIVWSSMKVDVRTMAKEMMSFTKNNILTQAAQAMLAQAQQSSQGVLQLLR